MPEMASREPNLHQRAHRHGALAQRHAPFGAAREPAASQLMGVGNSLEIPSLEGVAVAHRYSGGDRAAITLARTLVELNLGVPEDWETSEHDPTRFIQVTLGRWIEGRGGEAIRRRFDLTATISSFLDEYSESREEDLNGGTLYLTVESDAAAYLVLGPTLQLLDAEHPRLAMTFFEIFSGALNRWLRIYDYRDAQDRVEMWREWMEGEADRDQYEIPDVDGCIPECLKRKRLSRTQIVKLASQVERKEAKALVNRVLELARVSESAERPALGDEVREQLFDANPPLPGLLAVFTENDAVEGLFDEDMQSAQEAMPEPSVIIPFDTGDPASVQGAFETVGVACRTIALASRLTVC